METKGLPYSAIGTPSAGTEDDRQATFKNLWTPTMSRQTEEVHITNATLSRRRGVWNMSLVLALLVCIRRTSAFSQRNDFPSKQLKISFVTGNKMKVRVTFDFCHRPPRLNVYRQMR